jgi:hypothetical protein
MRTRKRERGERAVGVGCFFLLWTPSALGNTVVGGLKLYLPTSLSFRYSARLHHGFSPLLEMPAASHFPASTHSPPPPRGCPESLWLGNDKTLFPRISSSSSAIRRRRGSSRDTMVIGSSCLASERGDCCRASRDLAPAVRGWVGPSTLWSSTSFGRRPIGMEVRAGELPVSAPPLGRFCRR